MHLFVKKYKLSKPFFFLLNQGFQLSFDDSFQATNYVLEHQEADSQGELETKLIKVRVNF